MTSPDAAPADVKGGHDAQRWREAARLRHDRPGWVIIWLAPASEFRAYRRLPGTRHDTTVAAATAGGLAVAMTRAEQAAPRPRSHRQAGR